MTTMLSAAAIVRQLRAARGNVPFLDLRVVGARLARILHDRPDGPDSPDSLDSLDNEVTDTSTVTSARCACAVAWDAACGVGAASASSTTTTTPRRRDADADADAEALQRSRGVLTALMRRVRDAASLADVLSLASADRTWRAAFLSAPPIAVTGALEAAGHPARVALAWASRTHNTPVLLQLLVASASVASAAVAAHHAWVAPLSVSVATTCVAYVSAAAGGHADVCAAVLRLGEPDPGGVAARLRVVVRALTVEGVQRVLQLCLLAVAGACDRADARSDDTHLAACMLVAPVTAALEAAAAPGTAAVQSWTSHVWQAALVASARADHERTAAWLLEPSPAARVPTPSLAARRRALYDAARHGAVRALRLLLPAALDPDAAHVTTQALARAFAGGSADAARELLARQARCSDARLVAVATTALHMSGAASRETGVAWGSAAGLAAAGVDPLIARVLLGWHPPRRAPQARLDRCAAVALQYAMPASPQGPIHRRTFLVLALSSASLPALARAIARAMWDDASAAGEGRLPMEALLAMANTPYAHVVDALLDDLDPLDVGAAITAYRTGLTRALWNAGRVLLLLDGDGDAVAAWRATRDRLATLLAPHGRCPARADALLLAAAKQGPPGCIQHGLLCPVLRDAWRFSTDGVKAALDALAARRAPPDAACAATLALLDVLASHVPVCCEEWHARTLKRPRIRPGKDEDGHPQHDGCRAPAGDADDGAGGEQPPPGGTVRAAGPGRRRAAASQRRRRAAAAHAAVAGPPAFAHAAVAGSPAAFACTAAPTAAQPGFASSA